jgi:hypothetical protein
MMEADQRPIMWPTSHDAPSHKGNEAYWSYDFKNIGKSPALDVEHEAFMQLGDGWFRPDNRGGRPGKAEIIPAGEYLWATVFVGATKREFEAAKQKDFGIGLLVMIRYRDARGERFAIRRCFSLGPSGAVRMVDPPQSCEDAIAR